MPISFLEKNTLDVDVVVRFGKMSLASRNFVSARYILVAIFAP